MVYQLIFLAAEEVKNSAIVVPQSMMMSLYINGAFTIAFSIAILFGIGDIKFVLTSATKFPIISIYFTATGSKAATTALISALILTLIFATFGTLASASRLTWAFARDKGLPFSDYISRVRSCPI